MPAMNRLRNSQQIIQHPLLHILVRYEDLMEPNPINNFTSKIRETILCNMRINYEINTFLSKEQRNYIFINLIIKTDLDKLKRLSKLFLRVASEKENWF
jgi:hypothetical protein